MIKYKPENIYFNWNLPDKIPSEHWQQILTCVPYEEIIKYLADNPSKQYIINKGLSKCSL